MSSFSRFFSLVPGGLKKHFQTLMFLHLRATVTRFWPGSTVVRTAATRWVRWAGLTCPGLWSQTSLGSDTAAGAAPPGQNILTAAAWPSGPSLGRVWTFLPWLTATQRGSILVLVPEGRFWFWYQVHHRDSSWMDACWKEFWFWFCRKASSFYDRMKFWLFFFQSRNNKI